MECGIGDRDVAGHRGFDQGVALGVVGRLVDRDRDDIRRLARGGAGVEVSAGIGDDVLLTGLVGQGNGANGRGPIAPIDGGRVVIEIGVGCVIGEGGDGPGIGHTHDRRDTAEGDVQRGVGDHHVAGHCGGFDQRVALGVRGGLDDGDRDDIARCRAAPV